MRDVKAIASIARQEASSAAALEHMKREADDRAIAESQAGIGAGWVQPLKDAMPEVAQLDAIVQAWPDRNLRLLTVTPAIDESVTAATSCAMTASSKSNFAAALHMDWDTKVAPVCGARPAAPMEPGAGVADPDIGRCRVNGICVCSEDGKLAKRMCSKFFQQYKPSVRARSQGREKLLAGKLVLQLHWEEVPIEGAPAAAAAPAGEEGMGQGDMY